MRSRYLPVPLDYLTDDELHQFLDENRIETGALSKFLQAIILMLFPSLIDRRQVVFRLQKANLIRTPEAFGEHMDKRGVDVIDRQSER
nr:hypothetical protein [Pseudomonas sp. LTJR-52]